MNRKSFLLIAPVLLVLSLAGSASASPALDPFVSLIERKKPEPRPTTPVVVKPRPPVKRGPPPLVIDVLARVGGADEEMALIAYKGGEFLVGKGWDGVGEDGFDGRFRVIEVEGDAREPPQSPP